MKKNNYFLENRTIYTLYTLRFIFFIFIFVHHCYKYVQIPILKQSSFAVSGFIILSGFLNGYIYINKDLKIEEAFGFTIKRIKKFYPLHILMILLSFEMLGVFNYTTMNELFTFFKKITCNVLLIQSWINNQQYYFGFNGVTWFLSTYVFLTALTIPIMILFKQLIRKKHGYFILSIISIVLFAITIMISFFIEKNHYKASFCEFWVYVFPPSRLFEYMIGIIYGIIINNKKINFKYDKAFFSILEIIIIISIYIFLKYNDSIPYFKYFFNAWFNAYIIPSMVLIIVFSLQKGIVSYLLSLKSLVYLGKISMYMFLTHQVIIRYISKYSGGVVHYRYLGLYMLIMTIVFGSIIDKYVNNKTKK